MAKIAVLLSGGVDSSVALRLLQREGHELEAFYLKIWLEDELEHLGECPWEDDLRDARAVCEAAGVPLRVVPLQREYHRRVIRQALAELRAGRTPSPDVLCNSEIKFGVFLDSVDPGFDAVASGHYARVRAGEGGYELWRGADPVKDQTYFLCRLDQRQLARCRFPLGGYRKTQIRALARELALPNAERKDSQGICFLGQIRFDDFVRAQLGERPGEIRDRDTGALLGRHRGLWFHTIGQRRGLGLGGGPWYVTAKDQDANRLIVCHGDRLAEHRCDRFRIADFRWLGAEPAGERFAVRVRHTPESRGCRVRRLPAGGLEIRLDDGDPGIAEGQWAVLYDGERCLGGGRIGFADPPAVVL